MSVTLGNSAVNGSGTLEIQVAAANAATIAANSQINFAVALPVSSGGTGVTTKTGTGAVVLGTSPQLTTPSFASTNGFISLPTIIDSATAAAPLYMCRAWVNFNGIPTLAIKANGNVSSVTYNAVGDYTVNFTTAMPDVNYSAVTCGPPVASDILSLGLNYGTPTKTISAMRFLCKTFGTNSTDTSYASIAFFR